MASIIFLSIQIYVVLLVAESMANRPLIKPIIAHSKQFFELVATLITVVSTLLASIIGLAFKLWGFLRDLLKKR